MKQNKKIYYTKYFENNWNNIKNTWKGIKTIISIKNITATFNFTSVAKKTNSNIKFSPKHYTNYLSYSNTDTFFLTPTDKNQTLLIISFLDSHKSSGPNSIPVNTL